MTDHGGGVHQNRGPFTYHLKEVPHTAPRKMGYKSGPSVFIVQRDANGNEYNFAEVNPLTVPGEAEWAVKVLNRAATKLNV